MLAGCCLRSCGYRSTYWRRRSSTTSPMSLPSSTALAEAWRLRAVGMRTLSWDLSCFILPWPLGTLVSCCAAGLRRALDLLPFYLESCGTTLSHSILQR